MDRHHIVQVSEMPYGIGMKPEIEMKPENELKMNMNMNMKDKMS